MSRLRTTATLAVTACVLASAMTGTAVASSEPVLELGVGVIGNSRVTVLPASGGWSVCAGGDIEPSTQIVGLWSLQITGVRGVTPFALPTWTSSALSVYHCVPVSTGGSVTGSFSVDFGFLGVGSYVVARSEHGAAWGPVVGNQPFGVDPTP